MVVAGAHGSSSVLPGLRLTASAATAAAAAARLGFAWIQLARPLVGLVAVAVGSCNYQTVMLGGCPGS